VSKIKQKRIEVATLLRASKRWIRAEVYLDSCVAMPAIERDHRIISNRAHQNQSLNPLAEPNPKPNPEPGPEAATEVEVEIEIEI
jgi:hypothetical protein